MVCFVDTYWVHWAAGNVVAILPPSHYDPFWITSVYAVDSYYVCSYRKLYPITQWSEWQ